MHFNQQPKATYFGKTRGGKQADKSTPFRAKEPPREALGERRRINDPAVLHFIRIHLQAVGLVLVSLQSRNTG